MWRLPALVLFGCTCLVSGENILVLPFSNFTKISSLDWVGESVAESIREELAAHGELVVERDAREEVFRRLGLKMYVPLTRGSAMDLATNANAGIVIAGEFTVQDSAPRQIRIVARITNVRQGLAMGEAVREGPLDDLPRLQAQVVWHMMRTLAPGAAGEEEAYLAARPVIRLDAMESYVRALMASAPELRHKWLSQAIRLQPDYSPANFEMGRDQYERKEYTASIASLKKVSYRDAHYRQALFYLGLSYFEKGEYLLAEDALARVAAEAPLPEVMNNLGAAQLQEGKPEALENFLRAIEDDPADPDYQFNAGYALWKAGKYDQAAGYLRAALDRSPGDQDATLLLGRCLKQSGPRAGDLRTEGLVLLKSKFNESAWLQLKAMVQKR